MVGTMEMASTEAKMVAEPVLSSTHIDIANRSIILPNSEMPCPATSSTKSRDSSGRWVAVPAMSFSGFTVLFILSLSPAPLRTSSCPSRRP